MKMDYSEEEVRSVNLTHSLVVTQLYPEARHRSSRLELGLDAVDDRIIFSALSLSVCSTTCCCITSVPFLRSIDLVIDRLIY